MDFSEITERQPFLDFAYDVGQDLGADHATQPRIFKSHQLLSAVNPGAKYLSIVRDPANVLRSWFYFQKAKGRTPYAECSGPDEYVGLEHFGRSNTIFGTNIWDYYAELWDARSDPNVLVLSYEALEEDLAHYLPSIAAFLGVALDSARVDEVLRQSSAEYMKEHASQFDDGFIARRGAELGRAKVVMKVGAKITAGHQPLHSSSVAWVADEWMQRMTARTGLESYADMRAVFAKNSLARAEL